MDPKKLFHDTRFNGVCVYCGAFPETRDHVPSKVLLDEPFPLALPVVPCCKTCNNSFSFDELYLACFIECVIHGTTDPEKMSRTKIKRILEERPQLRDSIERSKSQNGENLIWIPDDTKVKNIIMKLARGHAAYELSEPQMSAPEYIRIAPYGTLSEEEHADFENSPSLSLWPEIGSRAFVNSLIANNNINLVNGWSVIQDSTYRYMVSYEDGISIKIVMREYLFCEIIFS
ncbi:hypothetical protein ATI02_5848 [Pseudomonas baetica]|uniref:HNH endonuclease n=1 Tax=Pseudomonas baetica TaxID=674054 RepID=A0ABX4Q7R0_9PSED|nr:hypothetical protein [Pseudomonas baetica]PKA72762.1 hypothetical protein ATI02_5848 [Pseudomonas baetica]PTC16813.1 hypothetical protein C0J26_22875 [Pseudomonas baetica]